MPPVLAPSTAAKLSRLRLAGRRRVEGRFTGAHASRRYGSSLDFADYREYVPGDDPRRVDVHAHARLGKRLVKLFEAEDEAALRIVVDLSASMGFGRKAQVAREVAAAFALIATGGGDRVRVLVSADGVDAGPWFRGGNALPAIDARLAGATAGGTGDLTTALHRAVGEGPRGPLVLVSDLLLEGWEDVVAALGLGRADTCLVHVLGRDDVTPDLDGDLRLVDAETGAEIEVGLAGDTLAEHAQRVREWCDEVEAACGRQGVAYVRHVDDQPLDDLLLSRLPAAGIVA